MRPHCRSATVCRYTSNTRPRAGSVRTEGASLDAPFVYGPVPASVRKNEGFRGKAAKRSTGIDTLDTRASLTLEARYPVAPAIVQPRGERGPPAGGWVWTTSRHCKTICSSRCWRVMLAKSPRPMRVEPRRVRRVNKGVVAVLVPQSQMAERVRWALGARTSLCFTSTWAELKHVVARVSPSAIIADPLADESGDPARHLAQFSQGWRIPVVLYARLTPPSAGMLLRLGQAGIHDVIFYQHDDAPPRFVAALSPKHPEALSFLFAGLALGAYLLYLAVRLPHSWHDLGFRRDNLIAGLLPVGGCTAVVGAGLVAFAVVQGRAVWQPAVLVLLALYPFWALAQQFAFQGLFHGGVKVLVQSPYLQVLLTAAAFASVHVGNATLFALTFVAGIMWSLLYRRWPNLWLLAGSHTILAALAYPLVLGDAPLSRL